MFTIAIVGMCFACNDGHTVGGHQINEYFDNEGVISLSVAAAEGKVSTIDRLVASGVDVNTVGKGKITPLWWAYLARSKEGFKSLLEHGGDPNIQDDKGRSIMCSVAADEESEYLRLALASGGNPNLLSKTRDQREPTPIFCAVGNKNAENVKALIDAGAELNYQKSHEETTLLYAANLNWWGIVYVLLEGGADYTIGNSWGKTIVDRIETNRIDTKSVGYQWRQKVIEFLRERGVKVNPKIP